MVSYYQYSQKHNPTNLAYPGQWQWASNYHAPPNHQYLSDMETSHAAHHPMYYNHTMFHSGPVANSEWHSPSSVENFTQNASATHQLMQQHHLGSAAGVGIAGGGGGSASSLSSGSIRAPTSSSSPHQTAGHHLNNSPTVINNNNSALNNNNNNNNNSNNNNNNNNRTSPIKNQYYDWMKKPSYPSQPKPVMEAWSDEFLDL
uniref:Uncharacterized protein n=1 Tax=Glossina morsitans morsitans TaxID=37546 RepID=A0A1B0FLT4_GLOMM